MSYQNCRILLRTIFSLILQTILTGFKPVECSNHWATGRHVLILNTPANVSMKTKSKTSEPPSILCPVHSRPIKIVTSFLWPFLSCWHERILIVKHWLFRSWSDRLPLTKLTQVQVPLSLVSSARRVACWFSRVLWEQVYFLSYTLRVTRFSSYSYAPSA